MTARCNTCNGELTFPVHRLTGVVSEVCGGCGYRGPAGVRRTVAPHPAGQLDAFAQPRSDDGASLLELAERAAWEIIRVQGSFTVGEVRESLGRIGVLANDGSEKLDCLGSLGRKMGCVAGGAERMSDAIKVSHRNRQTRWYPPRTPAPLPDAVSHFMVPAK